MKYLITFSSLFFLFSCSSRNEKLEFALQQAENNRLELEKVLNHYKNDSLKYKSAVFLIENMPYYSYQVSSEIDSTKDLLTDIFEKWDFSEKERQKGILFQRTSSPTIKQDIKEIKANLLIENIDYAFKVWKERSWNRHLSFEDFCELILPYRIAEEPLTNWRKKYYEKYTPILDSLYQGTDVVEACNILSDYLKTEKFYYFPDFGTPRQGAEFQFKNRIGTCRDACDIATYVMRAVGIPVTTDMYPYSPEYQIDHEWNVVRDTTGKYLPFWYEQFNAVRDENFTDKRKKGKVFRMTYGLQSPVKEIKKLPLSLQKPFMKDVTSEYFGKNEVSIPFKGNIENTFIGVFTARNGWFVVGQGKIEKEAIHFESIEPFVIYQPLTYKNNMLIPITYPFMYKKDKVHIFTPENEKQEIALTRKYSMRKANLLQFIDHMNGVKIKGSNPQNSTRENTLCEVHIPDIKQVETININSVAGYQRIRYQAPANKRLQLAEIHFFDDKDNKIKFDTIYCDGKPTRSIDLYKLENSYDNNPVSFFETASWGNSIFFESRKKQVIKTIQIIPRNDDNFIKEGDIYELFYNSGEKGWISLGEQKATKEPVLYYKAPKNAVLWLKNKTRGKEEQIFTYENGRQVFPTFEEYGK
ncbi:hypothetical protein [Capnocytophaga canis]|uniref:hypothetical protein n=1 Tax=Capnocytophaga canis TaxID=1848903 RepID=UPI001561E51F|nr:hypothetical protein [Capnocytophaga canis]